MEYYSDYLAHSSRKGSQRKNHKYTARQWVNGRWRYIYGTAKNAAGKLTGDYYESEANRLNKDAEYYNHEANRHFNLAVKDAAKERTPEEEKRYDQYWRNHKEMMDANFSRANVASTAARKATRKAENAPLKKASATIEKGRQAIANLFKTKTTTTVTSNLMPSGTKKTIKKK